MEALLGRSAVPQTQSVRQRHDAFLDRKVTSQKRRQLGLLLSKMTGQQLNVAGDADFGAYGPIGLQLRDPQDARTSEKGTGTQQLDARFSPGQEYQTGLRERSNKWTILKKSRRIGIWSRKYIAISGRDRSGSVCDLKRFHQPRGSWHPRMGMCPIPSTICRR